MILQSFYDLADLMKAKIDERNAMLGLPQTLYCLSASFTLVGAELESLELLPNHTRWFIPTQPATTNLGYDQQTSQKDNTDWMTQLGSHCQQEFQHHNYHINNGRMG